MIPREVIARCLEICTADIPPGLFVRWHRKIGDDLFDILGSIDFRTIDSPIGYLTKLVYSTEPTPEYEVRTSDGEKVVLLKSIDGVKVLSGEEAERFIEKYV